jgi:membrane protein
MLFGGGLLISVLPFLILLSAFASTRIDDELSMRLGLDRRAAEIMTHLFTSAPASLDAATVTSLLFVTIGTISVAGSLQQIYEKAFHQDHRGKRGLYRLLVWVAALCLAVAVETLVGRPVRDLADGTLLILAFTFAGTTVFFWWTMHFLLAGRVRWRRLLPSAIATGLFIVGLGVFSKFYFSATIVSDSKTYGAAGAIFSIMTWFIAIGAVIILGAVAGVAWADRKRLRGSAAEDLRLLGLELGVGEDSLRLQVREFLQLRDGVCGGRGRGRRGGLLLLLLLRVVLVARVLVVLLLRPAVRLAARDAVRHRGCGACDDGGAGDTPDESRHDRFLPG